MTVLVDTNTLIYYFQGKQPYAAAVERWITRGNLVLSVIVVAEFLVKATQTEQKALERLLSVVPVLPVDLDVSRLSAKLRRSSLRRSRVSLLDCLIAATAIIGNYHLATENKSDYPFRQIKFARF